MSGLDILRVNKEQLVEERDSLGSGAPLPTDIYPMVCEYLYIDQSEKSGALMVYGSFKEPVSGKSVRFSECVMSKKSGELKSTYTDKKTGKEVMLLGYTSVLSAVHAMGLEVTDLADLAIEPRELKLYDRDLNKETNQEKNVFVDTINAQVQIALYNVVETKMDKDDDGKYTIPTSEERSYNDFVKFFNAEGQTNLEVKNNEDASFGEEWRDLHKGKVRDKRSKDAPKAGAPKGVAGETKKKSPLKFS